MKLNKQKIIIIFQFLVFILFNNLKTFVSLKSHIENQNFNENNSLIQRLKKTETLKSK